VQAAWCMLQLPHHDLTEVEALYTSAALAVETAKQSNPPGIWDECYVLGECAVFHHDVTKKISLSEELYVAALAAKTSDNFAQVAANFAVFLHYEKKETARAMSWFEAAVVANPNLPAATTLFADFLIHTNQLERAVAELEKLLPTHRSEAWHKLGRIAERVVVEESYDTAIAAYCRALGAPDDADPSTKESVSDEFILRYCSQAEQAQLSVVNDLVMLLHYKTRRSTLVDQLYALLIQKFPEEVHLLMHYARFSVDIAKKRKKAHKLFRAAVDLDPSNITVLDHYAEFLAATFPDRLDAAEAVHLQSVRLNPDNAQAHFSYASFLTYVYKAPARAELHFKTALNIDPTDSLTLCCYATFLESQAEQRGKSWKFYQQSLTCAEWMHKEAVRLSPNNASHGVFLANFMWRQRRHSDAWPVLQAALQLEPGNVVTLRLAAMFLHDWLSTNTTHGISSEAMDGPTMATTAEALFNRALSLSPSDVSTLRGFAKFLEDVKRDHAAAVSVDAAATQIELADHDAAMAAMDEDGTETPDEDPPAADE
jgi:tetratricopeptide (TPR) repeat protein